MKRTIKPRQRRRSCCDAASTPTSSPCGPLRRWAGRGSSPPPGRAAGPGSLALSPFLPCLRTREPGRNTPFARRCGMGAARWRGAWGNSCRSSRWRVEVGSGAGRCWGLRSGAPVRASALATAGFLKVGTGCRALSAGGCLAHARTRARREGPQSEPWAPTCQTNLPSIRARRCALL